MKNRASILAGALLFGALTAQTTGSALADTQAIPFPGTAPNLAMGVEYTFTVDAPTVVEMKQTGPVPINFIVNGASLQPVAGSPIPLVLCNFQDWSSVIWSFQPGTYNLIFRAGPPFQEPVTSAGVNFEVIPGSPEVSDFQIIEEEGGLEVKWTNPPFQQRCQTDGYSGGVTRQLTWYRNGYQVGTTIPGLKMAESAAFIDSLTVGITYKVALTTMGGVLRPGGGGTNGELGQGVVGYGTPRIPSVLLMQAPSVVPPNVPFPIEVVLQDRKGRPITNEDVTLTYESVGVNATTAAFPAASKKLKTVKTNRKGVATAKVKLKKTGRIVATFNDSGKHAATLKSRTIKVKKGR